MPNRKKRAITSLELKRILIDICDQRVDVCVRFRLTGQMWYDQFVRVVTVIEDRALLNDEVRQKVVTLDLQNVVQFEIDGKFREFEPNTHYEITLFGPRV